MMGSALIFLATLGQAVAAADDPAELVRRLGSGRFAEREAAAVSLEGLGEAALPALREALRDPDPERRRRATSILDRIEAVAASDPAKLGRASQVRLDFVDRPLAEVVAEFGGPGLCRLAPHPQTPADVLRRRLTLREPGTVPFWPAIDRLCRAGDLHYIPGSANGMASGAPAEFRFYLAPGRVDAPRADFGPLRLEMSRIENRRSIHLVPISLDAPRDIFRSHLPFGTRLSHLQIDCRLVAEPRLLIDRVGDYVVAEAVDDRGQSLLRGPGPHNQGSGGNTYGRAQAAVPVGFYHLVCPERPGRTIRRLRLSLPVEVVSRSPDPLVIRLDGGEGKTFRHGDTTITVLSVSKKDAQGLLHVRLRLETDRKAPGRLAIPGTEPPSPDGPTEPAVSPSVIEVLDDRGRVLSWFGGPQGPYPHLGKVEVDMNISPDVGQAGAINDGRESTIAELRHYEYARAVILATFELRDVPLP